MSIVSLSYFTRGYDVERDFKQRVVGINLGLNIPEIINNKLSPSSFRDASSVITRYYKLPLTFFGLAYDLDHENYIFKYGLNYFY